MIHLAAVVLLTLLKLAALCVFMSVGYSLLMNQLRALLSFVDKAVDVIAALFFFVVIVPPVWLWHKARRPMWRTLTKEQTRDLESWLRRAAAGGK